MMDTVEMHLPQKGLFYVCYSTGHLGKIDFLVHFQSKSALLYLYFSVCWIHVSPEM